MLVASPSPMPRPIVNGLVPLDVLCRVKVVAKGGTTGGKATPNPRPAAVNDAPACIY